MQAAVISKKTPTTRGYFRNYELNLYPQHIYTVFDKTNF